LVDELTFLTGYIKSDFHLIEGGNGEFTVWRDNEQIYRKGHTDPFPTGDDIARLL
tara:strand:- start:354 stop:518 length:165 start_codon:yes stop_codon:yes gene_type:complete